MISKSTFESLCNNAGGSNIANINKDTSGESLLAATGSGGGVISSGEENDVIEYLNDTPFSNVYDSNSNLNWLVAGKKDPC